MDNSTNKNHNHLKIVVNRAQCKQCRDIIESTHRHDYISCRCKAIAVDGGHDYLKRVGNLDDVIELAEYSENRP